MEAEGIAHEDEQVAQRESVGSRDCWIELKRFHCEPYGTVPNSLRSMASSAYLPNERK